MTETEEFLATTMSRFTDAEIDLHNGDARGRLAMWSSTDPVTLFGADKSHVGAASVRPFFGELAARFSDGRLYENEIVAAEASGDLAYTVAYEHITASLDGGPEKPYVLRVTHIFRRVDGQWKVVHRHGDYLRT